MGSTLTRLARGPRASAPSPESGEGSEAKQSGVRASPRVAITLDRVTVNRYTRDMLNPSAPQRPNILLVMFDQLSPQSLPCYGHPLVRAPNLERLARDGVTFESAYCNSPLCAPSRFSMMAGKLASRIGAYDNAAEFPSSVPTFAHHLRLAGYRTCLSGKMHFIGADQLHGFEERITTDMYPADFGWTPEWDHPEKVQWWFHDMLSVIDAGPYDRSLEMDYDEEVAFQASRWLFDAARSADERPFLLTLSFIHPHDPYLAPREFWDLYEGVAIDMPAVGAIPLRERDPLSRRMYDLYDRGEHVVTPAQVQNARRAYYAMITYADALVGRVLDTLRATGQDTNTVVIATADHGDMLGERGLWYKMTCFERSVRVPLIFHAPQLFAPRRVPENVSLVDLTPTLCALAGRPLPPAIDGTSLVPMALGRSTQGTNTVYAEYMAEGTETPVFMIRRGDHKYITAESDPPQLFDLRNDPLELNNLAARDEGAGLAATFAQEAQAKWDGAALKETILQSQRDRLLVQEALLTGRIHPWDYEPREDAARRYNRNYGGELYDTDRRARIPFRAESKPRTAAP